jgi:hypothetical protein
MLKVLLMLSVVIATLAVACGGEPPPADVPTASPSSAAAPTRGSGVKDLASAPTPVRSNQFVYEGHFWVYPWDDRELGPAAKLANPVINPAWEPFAKCLEAAGVVARLQPGAPFGLTDLDALLVRLNAEYPDTAANEKIPFRFDAPVTDDKSAFLVCANDWLTRSAQEIYDITGVPNDYYPVPTVHPLR